MGYVDKATMALLGSDLLVNFASLDGSKLADITHADTNEHTLTPAALGLPANAIAVYVMCFRQSGTGAFEIATELGGAAFTTPASDKALWPIDDTGVFRYSLSVANDDWDVFGFAVVLQGRLEG